MNAFAHELRLLARDGRVAVLALAMLALLAATLATAFAARERRDAERALAEAQVRAQWDTQGDKHPHRGAHFGLYALRPEPALAAFDPGLLPYTGQALWLEPHRRNLSRHAPAADEPPATRFGRLTPAFALAALLPLLVIACAFQAVSGEREQGTLRATLALGLPPRRWLAAKFLAVMGAVLAVVLAGVAGALLPGLAQGTGGSAAVTLAPGRVAGLALGALLYLGGFAALALAVSARARQSRAALALLLGLWLASVFVVPRLAAAAAQALVPVPTAQAFRDAIARDHEQGLGGDGTLAERGARFDRALLARHGVSRLEDLPLGASAARRLARDAYADRVHALHFDRLWALHRRQEQLLRLAALASPTMAMGALSMAMAGTDLAHQHHFEDAAEHYRREVNTAIDRWDMAHTQGLRSFEERYAGDALWRSVPRWRYAAPGASFAWREAGVPLALLAAWAMAGVLLLMRAARRLRP